MKIRRNTAPWFIRLDPIFLLAFTLFFLILLTNFVKEILMNSFITRMTTFISSEAFEKKPRKLKHERKYSEQKIINGKTDKVSY